MSTEHIPHLPDTGLGDRLDELVGEPVTDTRVALETLVRELSRPPKQLVRLVEISNSLDLHFVGSGDVIEVHGPSAVLDELVAEGVVRRGGAAATLAPN